MDGGANSAYKLSYLYFSDSSMCISPFLYTIFLSKELTMKLNQPALKQSGGGGANSGAIRPNCDAATTPRTLDAPKT